MTKPIVQHAAESGEGPVSESVSRNASPWQLAVVAVVALAGGGGMGSVATGNSTAEQVGKLTVEVRNLKETFVREIKHLDKATTTFEARLIALEKSLRDHEKIPAHQGAELMLKEIQTKLREQK